MKSPSGSPDPLIPLQLELARPPGSIVSQSVVNEFYHTFFVYIICCTFQCRCSYNRWDLQKQGSSSFVNLFTTTNVASLSPIADSNLDIVKSLLATIVRSFIISSFAFVIVSVVVYIISSTLRQRFNVVRFAVGMVISHFNVFSCSSVVSVLSSVWFLAGVSSVGFSDDGVFEFSDDSGVCYW